MLADHKRSMLLFSFILESQVAQILNSRSIYSYVALYHLHISNDFQRLDYKDRSKYKAESNLSADPIKLS